MPSSSPALLPARRRAKNATSKEGFRLKTSKRRDPTGLTGMIFFWMYGESVCTTVWDEVTTASVGNPTHWAHQNVRAADPAKFLQRFTATVIARARDDNLWPE